MRYGGALAAGGFSMAFGIATALSVLVLLCGLRWFIFVKAGQNGWKSLIPIYSDYISYKIAWDSRIFSMLVVISKSAITPSFSGRTATMLPGVRPMTCLAS